MLNTAPDCTASRYRRLSGYALLLTLLLATTLADLQLTITEPWQELTRIGWGLLTPDFLATEQLLDALLNTLAFALIGVVIGNLVGFALALLFHHRLVRVSCAWLRAIHELFWALLLMQLFGLSPLTGILAIALPYSGIFAKVYAEILEEGDLRPWQLVRSSSDRLSSFSYARLPQALKHFRQYSFYRLECGLRSSAVLGFIGLPTLGFHLETAFSQGLYSQASALLYLFFALIASLRYWMRLRLLPVYLLAAWYWLPGSAAIQWSWIGQFIGQDLLPAPLRQHSLATAEGWESVIDWLWMLIQEQALPGIGYTLVLSLIALVLTGLVALLVCPLASARLPSRLLRGGGHMVLVVLRSIPELILAFIIMLLVGPSMLPAIIALALHNGAIIGYLIGQYANGLPPLSTLKPGISSFFYEQLPRFYPQFLAYLFYRGEVILRESAILGILGLHTLGFYIDTAFEELRFDRALVLILITALLNILVDSLSRRIRRQLRLNRTESNCR